MIVTYIATAVTIVIGIIVLYLMLAYPPSSFIGWICYGIGTVIIAASVIHLGFNGFRFGIAAL
jgi:hypothetical protein